MKFKRIFFYIILSIIFIIPSQIKAADYPVCIYKKGGWFAGNIYAAIHVVGSNPVVDIYSEQTGISTVWQAVFGGKSDSITKTYNKVVENKNGVIGDASYYFLSSECPSVKFCEDGGHNQVWIIPSSSNCNVDLATYDFVKELTEASVSNIDNALAFSYTGGTGNVKFSTILGSCPSEIGPFKLLGIAYTLLKIITPIALLLFATLDIAKAVAAGDDGKVKKAQQAAIKRLASAIIVFLSFVIVQYIAKLASNGSDIMSCVDKIIG